MHEDLIQRLQERIRRTPSTDLECVPAIQPRVALTPDKVERAELELGFMLPSLLRSLYLQVANGGYGPGWGILPIAEIVEWDHVCRANWEDVFPPRNWPDKLIRFCEWGCNFWSGIDCSSERCAIIRFDPTRTSSRSQIISYRNAIHFPNGSRRGWMGTNSGSCRLASRTKG